MSVIKITSTTNYKNQTIQFQQWTNWNNQPASAYVWQPAFQLRQEMPWLPVSMGRSSLSEIKTVIDNYLDNVAIHQANHKELVNAQIS
jgi:hypothetical protein